MARKRQVYSIPVKFVFTGVFKIRAESRAQANEHADKHCGLVIGGNIHSSLPEGDVDWDFPTHPKKHIRKS